MEIVMDSLKDIASDVEVSSEAMGIDDIREMKEEFRDLIINRDWDHAKDKLHSIQMVRMDRIDSSRSRTEIYQECAKVFRNSNRWAGDATEGTCDICERDCLVDNRGVCAWCVALHYQQCDYCRDLCIADTLQERRGRKICEDCAEKYVSCPNCGKDLESTSSQWEESLGMCYQCAHNKFLRPYNWNRELGRRDFKKLGSEDKVTFFGVEAEVDGNGNFGQAIASLRDLRNSIGTYWDLVHDGSLREGKGFEIVTVPASWKFHVEEFPWEEIFEICEDSEFHADDCETTGLHIHVGKKQISSSTASNMNLFVAANPAFVQRVARRRDTRGYAKFKSLSEARRDGCNSKERYEAVNFQTGGKPTIEFRMFQGTIVPHILYGSIEFIRSLLEFCSEHPEEEVTNDAVERYLDWVDHDKFNNLSELL